MHRVKRPSPKAEEFGFSQVHSRITHENFGDEPKARVKRRHKMASGFQLNQVGGPLDEEFGQRS